MTGFDSKRAAAADKLQEPINLLEARRIAAEYGTPDSQVDNGNLYFALSKCLEHIDAQPAQGPVAWAIYDKRGGSKSLHWSENHSPDGDATMFDAVPLYTTLPKREWVGLTDDELADLWYKESLNWMEFARAVIAKLQERNS